MSSTRPARGVTLVGREPECHVIDGVLADVRQGTGRVIVLRGAPGCGKTALLRYALSARGGLRVVSVTGVESETDFPYAGLHQLCSPLLGRVDQVPSPQRDALLTALGLRQGAEPDRFLVSLAVLSLLASAAEDVPVLCVVDDAHWLDDASQQALGFVARRLVAEHVAMAFAVRSGMPDLHLAGLPTLTVDPLRERDAQALLEKVVPGPLDPQVRNQILAEAQGNPLALLELGRLSTSQIAGGFGLLEARPVDAVIEQAYLARVRRLPMATQTLLLLAAAEPTGNVPLLWRACQALNVHPAAAEPAREAGILEIAERVRFLHPLMRSAVYRGGSVSDRTTAHRALAESTDERTDPDRRAWHRALAASEPDDAVATDLERSAGRAQARGGLAAAAAFRERAVAATPNPGKRSARAVGAAEAALLAGSSDAAVRLIAVAEVGPLDDHGRARLDAVRARLSYAVDRSPDAAALLLAAGRALQPFDQDAARDANLEALSAALFAGSRHVGLSASDVARRIRALPAQPGPRGPADLLLEGLTALLADGDIGRPALAAAVQAFCGAEVPVAQQMRWSWLACTAAAMIWDFDGWYGASSRYLEAVRSMGALGELAPALSMMMLPKVLAGELGAALVLNDEMRATVDATRIDVGPYISSILASWNGLAPDARSTAEAALAEAIARGDDTGVAVSGWSLAVQSNARGDVARAMSAARAAAGTAVKYGAPQWALVELVEAATRGSRLHEARGALDELQDAVAGIPTNWSLGLLARCRALVGEDDGTEELYQESIERLDRTPIRAELSRSHLVYGEWLRRERRRSEAVGQLRRAHELSSQTGLQGYAERAAKELRAAGEPVSSPMSRSASKLTVQEEQVARLAREGLSNPEIGGRLFLSPRTVEWHLGKVFAKLGIRSRGEISAALDQFMTS